LIVDEVFANQVYASSYSPDPTPFTSILSLDLSATCNPARIHVLAGPTKDFGASGVKAGALVSQDNVDVIKVITAALEATPISSTTDAVLTVILNNEEYCDWFLEENRNRLRKAFELIASWCEFHHLPYV
jgi:aspartate/methionine/tyrosine aminotransferase